MKVLKIALKVSDLKKGDTFKILPGNYSSNTGKEYCQCERKVLKMVDRGAVLAVGCRKHPGGSMRILRANLKVERNDLFGALRSRLET